MGAGRLSMRRILEILRFKYEGGLGHRAIARACGIGYGVKRRLPGPWPADAPGRCPVATRGDRVFPWLPRRRPPREALERDGAALTQGRSRRCASGYWMRSKRKLGRITALK